VDDIPILAEHFLSAHSAKLGQRTPSVTGRALHCLQAYAWPGNVRELENVLERAVVLSKGEPLDVPHLPRDLISPLPAKVAPETAEAFPTLSLPQAVENLEKELIGKVLAQTADNKAKAARLLDISERALWYKVKKYGLS
jgi:two-component system response regulator AtoC